MLRALRAMTLVDVLAAIVILASTVTILAPLTIEARTRVDRSADALALHAILSQVVPPTTSAGEREDSALPDGCRLRWLSASLPLANNSSHARLLTIQVVHGLGVTERILAERFVPLPSPP